MNRIAIVQSIWMQTELEKREIDFDFNELGRPVPKQEANKWELEIFEILEHTCSVMGVERKSIY